MKRIRKQLMEGIWFTYQHAAKFKTGIISAQFISPIQENAAAANALIPAVLLRGTMQYPTIEALSARTDHLYGADINLTVRKVGENHCFGFIASMIDDKYVPGGERLLEPVTELLGELICNPVTENGRFAQAFVDSEKNNIIDDINSVINDKREYAGKRLLEEFCAGEPYAVSRLGSVAAVKKLNSRTLFSFYRKVLSTTRLEFYYCGSADINRVENALLSALYALPAGQREEIAKTAPHIGREEIKHVTEELDVTQGKLGIGLSCGKADKTALMIGNTLFGGSSNSKLFMNVREKLSLCYYASSVYHKQKNIITISSGIEFENRERTYDEILHQLEAVQNGCLEDWELESARKTLTSAYASLEDSLGRMENFWLGQIIAGTDDTPQELADKVLAVSAEEISEAMRSVRPDTVYFLKGKEAAE